MDLKVSIIFVRGNGLVSPLIKYFGKSQYSHVAFKFNDVIFDVRLFSKAKFREDRYKCCQYDEIELRLVENSKLILISKLLSEKLGKKYSYLELIRFFNPLLPDNPNRNNCVEIAEVLSYIGFDINSEEVYSINELKAIIERGNVDG